MDNESVLMTLKQYFENPYGKGATFVNIKAIQDDFERRYDNILKGHKNIKTNVFKEGEEYYIIAHIPSESLPMDYQVVLQLSPTEESKNQGVITNYAVKFYSNCPSFVFTYAYVFNIHNMLIDKCANKLNPDVLKGEPFIKNYYKIIGYEKSLYYACKWIINNLEGKATLDKQAKKFDLKEFLDLIDESDEKMEEFHAKKKKESQLKKSSLTNMLMDKVVKEARRRDKMRTGSTTRTVVPGPESKTTPKSKITGRSKIKGKTKIK